MSRGSKDCNHPEYAFLQQVKTQYQIELDPVKRLYLTKKAAARREREYRYG